MGGAVARVCGGSGEVAMQEEVLMPPSLSLFLLRPRGCSRRLYRMGEGKLFFFFEGVCFGFGFDGGLVIWIGAKSINKFLRVV